jgi:hypothetical protein
LSQSSVGSLKGLKIKGKVGNKERLAVFCGQWARSSGKSSPAQGGKFFVVLPNRSINSLELVSLLQHSCSEKHYKR